MTPKTRQIRPISLELPKNSFQIINQKKKFSAPQMCKITQSPSVKQFSGCTKFKNGFSKILFYGHKKIIAKSTFVYKRNILYL